MKLENKLDKEKLLALVGESASEEKRPYTDFENSTYQVVSKFAYLIGVPYRIFENEHEPPQMKWYDELKKDKNARIIRNLCLLRTAIERNFGRINEQMTYYVKNLGSLPELVPVEALGELSRDGIEIEKVNTKPAQYIIDLNRHISNRINNCKSIFPIWIKWDYLRQLFIMPNGTTEAGTRAAADEYYRNLNSYPYQVYMNWASLDRGNILYSDKKFVELLYEENNDIFTDLSKVTDAGNVSKSGIYEFLDNSEKTEIIVDCENSDPYKLYATLKNLDQQKLLGKIAKIILIDDVNTTPAWGILQDFTDIEIQHEVVERLKENKSLVDMTLSALTSIEHYENGVDSFILASSDSDYWALVSAMKSRIKFLFLIESGKVSSVTKNALVNAAITYCYMDDFNTGNSGEVKITAVLNEVRAMLNDYVNFNIYDVLSEAYYNVRAEMTPAEKKQFYDRYIKPMRLTIDKDGEVRVEMGE